MRNDYYLLSERKDGSIYTHTLRYTERHFAVHDLRPNAIELFLASSFRLIYFSHVNNFEVNYWR